MFERSIKSCSRLRNRTNEAFANNGNTSEAFRFCHASLDKFEAGDFNSWWELNLQLGLTPYSRYVDELEFDLRKMPGWKEATDHTRSRIIEAAKHYVIKGEPRNDEWLGMRTIFRPAFSGYRALYLLFHESPEFVKQVPINVWQKWAAIVVSYPLNSFGGDEMIAHQLLATAVYSSAPDEVINAVLTRIDADNKRGESFYFHQRLEACWDIKFKDALRYKLNDNTLKTSSWGAILDELLEQEDAPSQKIAQDVLSSFVAGQSNKEHALIAAAGLMQYGKGDGWWPFVWEAIKRDSAFGQILVESVCSRTNLTGSLKEDEASEFYLWLVKVFPPADDPKLPTGHAFAVTTRMEITKFRNSFLNDLKKRGTPESLAALEKIAATSPELEKQLHWTLIEARQNVRRHTWRPQTPSTLLTLLKKSRTQKLKPFQTTVQKFWQLTDNNLFWAGGIGFALAAYGFQWASAPPRISVPMLAMAWVVICASIFRHRFFEGRSALLQIIFNAAMYILVGTSLVMIWLFLTSIGPPK